MARKLVISSDLRQPEQRAESNKDRSTLRALVTSASWSIDDVPSTNRKSVQPSMFQQHKPLVCLMVPLRQNRDTGRLGQLSTHHWPKIVCIEIMVPRPRTVGNLVCPLRLPATCCNMDPEDPTNDRQWFAVPWSGSFASIRFTPKRIAFDHPATCFWGPGEWRSRPYLFPAALAVAVPSCWARRRYRLALEFP